MTDAAIESALNAAFLTLNEASGRDYIAFSEDSPGVPANVALPNRAFAKPADRKFFVLYYLPGRPTPEGMGTEAGDRYSGVYQIDICVPPDSGKDEAEERFGWIKQIFRRGAFIGGVTVTNCYRGPETNEEDFYRVAVRAEWTAVIPR